MVEGEQYPSDIEDYIIHKQIGVFIYYLFITSVVILIVVMLLVLMLIVLLILVLILYLLILRCYVDNDTLLLICFVLYAIIDCY